MPSRATPSTPVPPATAPHAGGDYDVLVAGGGPAGATAALVLARAGHSVLVVERAAFPRFHVGESLLPRNLRLLHELDLMEALQGVPRLRKLGAEFALGHDEANRVVFDFSEGLLADLEDEIFNVERASFDAAVLDAAAAAGAEVRQTTAVRRILRLADGDVELELAAADSTASRVTGRYLLDASGQSTLVGKHLGLRRDVPGHARVACFGHYRGVERLPGQRAGHPCIAMMADGWFWLIAIDDERTSVGVVMDRDDARRVQQDLALGARDLLAWAIPRCPLVARRTAGAEPLTEPQVAADFSYRCHPYAGPGFFLVGDAAAFLDPIFSTGLCLGMLSGREAANHVAAILDGAAPRRRRAAYRRFVEGSSRPLFRLVRQYYRHSFRELMMSGEGPLDVHRALFSILAGHVFPRPAWSLRWRHRLMDLVTAFQARRAVAPRQPQCYMYDVAAGEAAEVAR